MTGPQNPLARQWVFCLYEMKANQNIYPVLVAKYGLYRNGSTTTIQEGYR